MSDAASNPAPEVIAAETATPGGASRQAGSYFALAAVLAAAAVGFVLWRAWVCDDAFITFRHVANCLAGYGPVFNPGERVQGFTHPLWFLLLLGGARFFDVYAVAVWLGLLATLGLILGLAWSYHHRPHGRLMLLGAVAFLLSSNTFVEFQTSGLETALTSLLLALLFALTLRRAEEAGPPPVLGVAWLCSLLLFTRPDHLVVCGPLLVWALWKGLCGPGWMRRLGVMAALVPPLVWYGFAAIYYGTPLPNTAYAKLALPLAVAIPKGITYLVDYAFWEPCHAVVAALVLVWSATRLLGRLKSDRARWLPPALLLLGVGLQLAYVISIGGDFMRGRLFLPALIAAAALGGFMLPDRLPASILNARPPVQLLVAVLAIALAGGSSLVDLSPRLARHDPRTGIADEYAHYAGPRIESRFREPARRWDGEKMALREMGNRLRELSEANGSLTVAYGAIGMVAYHAGPKVAVLDPYGLTDAFIARCPAEPASRIGHVGHLVPAAYFRLRQTIPLNLWQERGYDPTAISEARAMAADVRWPDDASQAHYQLVQRMIAGEILSRDRLTSIPGYALTKGF